VFDPLAIALIIAFNGLVMRRDEEKVPSMYEVYGETPIIASEKDAEVLFESISKDSEPNETLKEAARKYSEEVKEKHVHIDDFDVNTEDLKKKSMKHLLKNLLSKILNLKD
jgi:hypothetical protein